MFAPIALFVGYLLIFLSIAFLCPMGVDYYHQSSEWLAFLKSAAITLGFGGLLVASFSNTKLQLKTQQFFILAPASWAIYCIFSALPFIFCSEPYTLSDALFEATSGLTTTGATMIQNLDEVSKGILLWRALLHWIGGIGIIAMGVIILPFLRIGGMQLFQLDSSAQKTTKILPRASDVAKSILAIYIGLTIIISLALYCANMPLFDAICNGMSSIATGGFSTKDESIGFWKSGLIDFIIIIGMISGSLPFIAYISAIRKKTFSFFNEQQVKTFFIVIFIFTSLTTLWLVTKRDYDFYTALELALFNVTSIITTTGFATTDYAQWGTFTTMLFLLAMFIGGCSGSTSGGLKIYRLYVLFHAFKLQLSRLYNPSRVVLIHYNNMTIPKSIIISITVFAISMLFTGIVISLILSFYHIDFITALSASFSCVTNVGPGLGAIVGPAGNFHSIPDPAKIVLAIGMLLGRLEFISVFVLFSRKFWTA